MLTVGAGRGIRFNIFLQSPSQLNDVYGEEKAENILDNCMCTNFLKTGNSNTAEQISKRLGNYTCLSGSSSTSDNGHQTSSVTKSSNYISRPLLTADEIMRLKRPELLVMYAGENPLVATLPDLSKWHFNKMFGMGNPKHNNELRIEREKERKIRKSEPQVIWTPWKTIQKREENVKKLYNSL